MEDISTTLTKISTILNKLDQTLATVLSFDTDGQTVLSVIKEFNQMIQNWQKECEAITDTELGTIKVCFGSVFKCREIPVVDFLQSAMCDIYQVIITCILYHYH